MPKIFSVLRMIAIENSLERVDDRTTARHLGAIGTRAVLVNRSDEGAFARRIPAGYRLPFAHAFARQFRSC